MTVEEFLAWSAAAPSDLRWQLRDGEPIALAPGSDAHGSILGEAARLIANALIARGGPGRSVLFPCVIPRVAAFRNLRIADLGVTCAPPSGGLVLPAPLLLVEVVSPSDEAEARANLWAYTAIPTVGEVLFLETAAVGAEVFRRSEDGTWPEMPLTLRKEDHVTLTSIGLRAPLTDFYRTSGRLT